MRTAFRRQALALEYYAKPSYDGQVAIKLAP